ncbi:MAG: dicarboxylate/amino acid:cation symporter [Longimicrobiales bacterium]
MKLHTRILIGLVTGAAIGTVAKLPNAAWLERTVLIAEPVGTAFIRLITMVMVPLVVASLFVGVASLGDVRRLGRMGGKTLGYFLGTTIIAATIGTTLATLLRVGALDDAGRTALLAPFQSAGAALVIAAPPTLVQTLLAMIPQNPFAAAAQADLLPLIVAVCIFAAAATVIRADRRLALLAFFEAVNDVCIIVLGWLMRLAPLGVLVLVAAVVARSGLDLLQSLALYAITVVVALALHAAVTFVPVLRMGVHMGVQSFLRAVSDALLLAFSTASSAATLPVSMAAARNRLGVPHHIVAFVLPAGATVNKNGAAVYKAVTAVMIARLYGVELGAPELVTIVFASTMAAFAGAGVPGSSLVTTLIVLNAIGLGAQAAAAVALVAGIDRPLDMCRTTINTLGNLVGTAWIARSERGAVTEGAGVGADLRTAGAPVPSGVTE